MNINLTVFVLILGLGNCVLVESKTTDNKSHFIAIGNEILHRTEMVIQQMRIRLQPVAEQIELRDKATNLTKLMAALEGAKDESAVKCEMRSLFLAQCQLSVLLHNYLDKYPKNRLRTFGLY